MRTFTHTIAIREDFAVKVTLPVDFSPEEAAKVSQEILCLPFNENIRDRLKEERYKKGQLIARDLARSVEFWRNQYNQACKDGEFPATLGDIEKTYQVRLKRLLEHLVLIPISDERKKR